VDCRRAVFAHADEHVVVVLHKRRLTPQFTQGWAFGNAKGHAIAAAI